MATNYKKLLVWQKAYQLTLDVYGICKSLPADEIYGLRSQMQRSAVSIPSNIAEGEQRNSAKEFRNFLGIAKGSSAELETQLMIAHDVYGIDIKNTIKEIDEIQRIIHTLINKHS